MDQNYFVTPFASLGDQTVIPIPTDSGGAVSMQQGWGPDYQRDQASDPLAKPIDRATTNWLLFVATQAISALQRTGIPEWITTEDNNGTPLAYAKYAQVRYSATTPGVTFETYVSTIDGNTSVPGADANWQPIASIVASAADVVTGTSSRLPVTPLTLKSYPGNTLQTFNVAAGTLPTHAAQVGQIQRSAFNYAGLASGTANALTATLTIAPGSYADYLLVTVRVAANNTASVSLNVNGLGVVPVIGLGHQPLQGGELLAGGFATFAYSTNYGEAILLECTGGALQIAPAIASQHAVNFGQIGALQSLTASVASNALTVTLNAPTPLSFRNATLTSGIPVAAFISTNLSLIIPSGATLGTTNGNSARLVYLVAYNGGSPVLCVVNLNGAPNLDETTLISPTTISAGATTAGTIYSASAVSANSPFRVIGFCDIAEAAAGTWVTGPTTVQGIGGEALAGMSSIGYGQSWQNLFSSRAVNTTYVNSTGKPIVVTVAMTSSSTQSTATLTVNGVLVYGSSAYNAGAPASTVTAIIPPGAAYVASLTAGAPNLAQWGELR